MITNNDAQAAMIAWLKANANVLALHSNFPLEIRESQWQGEDYTLPAIRVSCEITAGECLDDCFTIISCLSDEKSSMDSQTIAGTIAQDLHNKTFTQSGYRFSAVRCRTLRAVQENSRWRADIQVSAKVK